MKNKRTKTEVLEEFISDINAVGQEHVAEQWPDLLETYRHAKEALKQRTKGKKDKRCKT